MKLTYSFTTVIFRKFYVFVYSAAILAISCRKEIVTPELPSITTKQVSLISSSSIVTGGDITSDGGAEVIARGVAYGTNQLPTLDDRFTIDGSGTGEYTSTLAGLNSDTQYNVRAYATNNIGTSYGNSFSFKTSAILPVITLTSVSTVTSNSANSGGNVTSTGGASVTRRGIAFSTSPNPTVFNNTTNDGQGLGVFSSNLTNLSPLTQYYIRAYATNMNGTAYSSQSTFTTLSAGLPILSTTIISNSVTSSGASVLVDITYDGGAPVTSRGLAYGTSPVPTIINGSTTNNGSGTGSFTGTITGLNAQTQYYVRGFATNIVGTGYGNQVTLLTLAPQGCSGVASVTDYDGNTYNTVAIGGQCWTSSNLKVSRYRNGNIISTNLSNTNWTNTTSGAYAIYNNITSNNSLFGKLYNHYAVTDSRGLCPIGWHVPSDAEWTTLVNHLGGSSVAGGALKSTATNPAPQGWNSPNFGASNSSGFTALPGGWRSVTGSYQDLNSLGNWWTSTVSGSDAWNYNLVNNGMQVIRLATDRNEGQSVRCLRD